MVEYTKAFERSILKELGKLPPYLRKKEALSLGNQCGGGTGQGVATVYQKHRTLLSRLQDDV